MRSALRHPLLALALASPALAETRAAAQAAPQPAPYSLPWLLRPAAPASVVRSDSSLARYQNGAGDVGVTTVSELTASYALTARLAPVIKLTVVSDSPPGTAEGGFAFVNPLLGATYGVSLGDALRFASFLGATVPVGMGGGQPADAGAAGARTAGVLARASMDNALFAVDDFTVIPGVDLAYVSHGLTAQVEATLLELLRVRAGDPTRPGFQPDTAKTNLTTGAHVGYFFTRHVSAGAELRWQHWLEPPVAAEENPRLLDDVSFGFGPRFHFVVGDHLWIRPGISYTHGLSAQMGATPPGYDIVQLDVPLVF